MVFLKAVFHMLIFLCVWVIVGTIIEKLQLSTPWVMFAGYFTAAAGFKVAGWIMQER